MAHLKGVVFLPSPSTATSDELIVGIAEAYNKLGVDHNKLPLLLAGLGRMTRGNLVSMLYAKAKALSAAGWDVIFNQGSPFDEIDL